MSLPALNPSKNVYYILTIMVRQVFFMVSLFVYTFLSGNFSFHIKINIAKLIYVFEENLEKEIHKHSLEIVTIKSLMHFLGVNAY